jgi:predicted dehydrogenase
MTAIARADVKRLLVVGLGSIGTRHARIARETAPGLQVMALRHRAGGQTPDVVDHCVSDIEAALAFKPQLAVIANPAPYHIEAATPLARAGVHLLVEKPFAHTASGAESLVQECATRGLTLAVGYNLRFSASLAQFRELLHQGVVGRVLSVRAEVGQALATWRPNADYRQTVSARASLGGGVLLELSHEIDYLRWIFGEIDSVTAVLRRQSSLEIDVEDTAHLLIQFRAPSGETPIMGALTMDFVRADAMRSCTAIGEKGTLRWDGTRVELFTHGASEWTTLFAHKAERDETYRAEWSNLLDAIAGHAPVKATGADGLATVRVLDAARASSELSRSIRVGDAP